MAPSYTRQLLIISHLLLHHIPLASCSNLFESSIPEEDQDQIYTVRGPDPDPDEPNAVRCHIVMDNSYSHPSVLFLPISGSSSPAQAEENPMVEEAVVKLESGSIGAAKAPSYIDAELTRVAFGFLQGYFGINPVSSSFKIALFDEQNEIVMNPGNILQKGFRIVQLQRMDGAAVGSDQYDASKVFLVLKGIGNGQMVVLSAGSGGKKEEEGEKVNENFGEFTMDPNKEQEATEKEAQEDAQEDGEKTKQEVLGYCSLLTKKEADEFQSQIKSGKMVAWVSYFAFAILSVLFILLVVYWLREGCRKDDGKRRKKKMDIKGE